MASSVDSGCNDLHVRVVNRRLVKASDSSMKPHVLELSNLDLLRQSMQQLSMLCVYPKPQTTGGDFNAVFTSFETGLPSLLNHFFPLAGRIATNPSSGLPEVHCDNQGAELVVGEAGVALASLDFSVVSSSLRRIQLPYGEDVALSVQLVSFACGGFTVAWCTHHVLLDGTALGMVVAAWSKLAWSGTLTRPPVHDRSLFRPRVSPSYDGAALDEAYTPVNPKQLVNVLTAQLSFVDRLYYIEAADIARLRKAATRDGGGRAATRLSAVSAYIWKTLASVVATAGDAHCRMGWWVDGRRRLIMASPPDELRDTTLTSYIGNVATFAIHEASVQDVLGMPMPDVADMVREAVPVGQAYHEHFQDLVDWVEDHKSTSEQYVDTAMLGLGSPGVCVTAFGLVPFDTDIGFGRATLAVGMLSPATTRRMCSGLVQIVGRPGNDGSWIVSAFVWPQLAAALEADEQRVFKPVTSAYLGLSHPQGPHCRL